MRHYELVIMLDPTLTKDDQKKATDGIEDMLKDSLIKKDDMGMLDTFLTYKGTKKFYFLSYYCSLNPDLLPEMRKKLSLMKPVRRYFFYSMNPSETFFTFAELKTRFENQQIQEKAGMFQEMERSIAGKKK